MTLIAVCVVYGICALACWRPLAGHIAWWAVERLDCCRTQTKPDGIDWFLAIIVGASVAAMWLVIPVLWASWWAATHTPKVGAEARHLRAARAEEIAKIEREVGL